MLSADRRSNSIDISEVRDVTNPALVSQMLMPLMETLGGPLHVPKLRKRVRDDVIIDADSEKGTIPPFRRHPFWLILRVAVERQLCFLLGDIDGRACYKFIVCIVLAQLLQESVGKIRPESALLLRDKLSRRLAKLEQERSQQQFDTSIYDLLFGGTSSWFKTVIEAVTGQVEAAWSNFKSKTKRRVERLPRNAPLRDLHMSLPNSGRYLDALLQLPPVQQSLGATAQSLQIKDEGIRQVQRFTKRYFDLAETERKIQE